MVDVFDVSYLAVPGERIGGRRLADMDQAVFRDFPDSLGLVWTVDRGSEPVGKALGTFGPSTIVVSDQGSVWDAG